MTKPAAFQAEYSDLKFIKTRGVVSICFEVSLADFHNGELYDLLGGLPDPATSRYFAIAALTREGAPQPNTAKAGAASWRDIPPAQQAGIRCADAIFIAFLKERHSDDWHEAPDAADCVRLICGVESRAELSSNQKARVIWHQLDEHFQAWKQVEHA